MSICYVSCIVHLLHINCNAHLLYLSITVEGRGRVIIKRLPFIHASVRLSVHSSRFYINLNISFSHKDIFTKVVENVYGYENLSVQNFDLILENKMAAIGNCLKIIKVL